MHVVDAYLNVARTLRGDFRDHGRREEIRVLKEGVILIATVNYDAGALYYPGGELVLDGGLFTTPARNTASVVGVAAKAPTAENAILVVLAWHPEADPIDISDTGQVTIDNVHTEATDLANYVHFSEVYDVRKEMKVLNAEDFDKREYLDA